MIRECIRRGLESLERERAAKAPKVAPKVETPIEAPKVEAAPKVAKNRRITDRVASDRERAAKAAAEVAAVFGGSVERQAKADKGNA